MAKTNKQITIEYLEALAKILNDKLVQIPKEKRGTSQVYYDAADILGTLTIIDDYPEITKSTSTT